MVQLSSYGKSWLSIYLGRREEWRDGLCAKLPGGDLWLRGRLPYPMVGWDYFSSLCFWVVILNVSLFNILILIIWLWYLSFFLFMLLLYGEVHPIAVVRLAKSQVEEHTALRHSHFLIFSQVAFSQYGNWSVEMSCIHPWPWMQVYWRLSNKRSSLMNTGSQSISLLWLIK